VTGTYVPTPQEFSQLLHYFEHKLWANGHGCFGKEAPYIAECWFNHGGAPEWALRRAQEGQPGARWCPILTPSLTEDPSPSAPQ
jgi:hypothetical protein